MIGVVVALAAGLAAVAFWNTARSARAQARKAEEEAREHEAAAREAQAQAKEARAEAKTRREEAVASRAELAAARKKAFEQAEAAKRTGGAQALREELDKLSTRLAEARAEAQAAGGRARALELQLERQAGELERARSAERASAERAAAERAAPPPPPAPAPPASDAAAAADRERAERAEARLAEARKKCLELEREVKAARGRLETEKRVYVVAKSEVELAHDRYAELKRRHDALRREHEDLIEAVREAAREEAHGAEKAEEPQPQGS
jgi:hypothetical protein